MSYCEIATWWKHSDPVARKEHVCCECSAPIHKGERHFYGAGVWDGDFAEYRQHCACMQACMLIRDEFQDGECIGFGDLFEAFGEMRHCLREDRCDEHVRKLRSLIAQIKWRERRERMKPTV